MPESSTPVRIEARQERVESNASLVGFTAGFAYLLLSLARPLAERYRKHLEMRLPT